MVVLGDDCVLYLLSGYVGICIASHESLEVLIKCITQRGFEPFLNHSVTMV